MIYTKRLYQSPSKKIMFDKKTNNISNVNRPFDYLTIKRVVLSSSISPSSSPLSLLLLKTKNQKYNTIFEMTYLYFNAI